MKFLKKITIVFVFLFSFSLIAQNEEKVPEFFENESAVQVEQLRITNSMMNNDYLKTQQKESNIALKQYGISNEVSIINNTFSNQKVLQYGNENLYKYQDYSFNNSMNIGVLQLGNKNSLNISGANSIFSGTKIIQSGGSRVTVNNF